MKAQPSGLQIAFLVFAVVFLAWPLHRYVGPLIGVHEPDSRVVGRLYIFIPAIAILLLVPGLRRFCAEQLGKGFVPGGRLETGLVMFAKVWMPFAIYGGVLLWYWVPGGEMALARRIGEQRSLEGEMALALTPEGFVFGILLAGLMAPVVEELIFRGLLYQAWERQRGWFWSMLATSTVYALYHPLPFGAFLGSILFVAVMRRTGTIWAPILVHAAGNIALYPPLLGQYYFQTAGKSTGEIALWPFHLAAFGVLMIALPVYLWMSRDSLQDGIVAEAGEAEPARS